ncbi:MAG: YfhO family protein [Actinobacteria bacterium]|nr:YfhO family protein [Actinomycetota bacterium]
MAGRGVEKLWAKIAALVAAPTVVFGDFLVRGRAILPGDGFIYYLPLHLLSARALRSGHLPVWNPFSFAGSPLLAVGQNAVFYPPNLAFALLSLEAANNLVTVLNFVVAGIGAFLVARRLTGDDSAALVAGLAFSLSGFMFGHVAHQSMTATVAWLPWTIYAYELLREAVTPRRLWLGGGTVALSILAGHSQMLVFEVVVLGLYAGFVMLLEWHTTRTRPLAPVALMVGLGAGLAAVGLLPTVSVLHDTARGAPLDYAAATSYSFPRSHVPLLAFPYLFGNTAPSGPFTASYRGEWSLTELNGYPGMAALALAAAGLGAVRRDRRILALAGVGVVGVLMAMGGSTPFGRLVYALPVLGRFRSWGRYVVALDLAVAVLAAYGVALLRSAGGPERSAALRRVAAVPLGVGVLAVWVHTAGSSRQFLAGGRSGLLAIALPLVAACAGAACCVMLARRAPAAAAITAGVVALDAVLCFGLFSEWRGASPSAATVRSAFSRHTPPLFGPVADEPGGIDRYLFAGRSLDAVPQQAPITDVKGVRSANGSEPLSPESYLDALRMTTAGLIYDAAPLWAADGRVLDLLRVSTVLVDPQSTRPLPGATSLLDEGTAVPGSRLVRHDYHPRLPEAFVVGETRRTSHDEVLAGLTGGRPFDPAATALLESDCRGCDGARQPGPAGSVSGVRWTAASVDVALQASRPGLLVLSQAWFPGWTASVDGRAAQVVRVDGLVQGVPVGPGPHRVRLSYRAPGLRAGLKVTLCTAGGLGLTAIARRRRRTAR